MNTLKMFPLHTRWDVGCGVLQLKVCVSSQNKKEKKVMLAVNKKEFAKFSFSDAFGFQD